jgi:hypothetical protein
MTTLSTIQGKEFSLEGPKREENIVFDERPNECFDAAILSMNKTFRPEQMYLIEAKSHSESPAQEGVYSVGIIRHYDNPQKNQDAKKHLKRVLKDALSQSPQPKRVVAKLLTNDDHWQLVMIDLQNGIEHPEIYVVNTTNMTKMQSLFDIQEEYFKKFGQSLNEVLKELNSSIVITPAHIRYIQGLQYGNMSCGIATDLNYQKISTLSHDKLNQSVFQTNDIVRKEVRTILKIDDDEFEDISFELDKALSTDRSKRYSSHEDARRRVEIFFEFQRRATLKGEILTKVSSQI